MLSKLTIILIIFTVLIIIYVLTFYIYLSNPSSSNIHFPTTLSPLTKQSIIHYIDKFNDADKHARSHFNNHQMRPNKDPNSSYVTSYIIQTPPPQLIEMTRIDITTLTQHLRSRGFTKHLLTLPWKISFISPHIENNLPHTHHDTIFLPLSYSTFKPITRLGLLLHEQLHVFQRHFPIHTHKLFLNFWRLHISGIRKPDTPNDDNLRRSNPDLNNFLYSHYDPTSKSLVHIQSVYNSKQPTTIIDSKSTTTQLQSKSHSRSQSTTYFKLIRDYHIRNFEHPNEVMAYLIPEIILHNKIHTPTQKWMHLYL